MSMSTTIIAGLSCDVLSAKSTRNLPLAVSKPLRYSKVPLGMVLPVAFRMSNVRSLCGSFWIESDIDHPLDDKNSTPYALNKDSTHSKQHPLDLNTDDVGFDRIAL